MYGFCFCNQNDNWTKRINIVKPQSEKKTFVAYKIEHIIPLLFYMHFTKK